MSCDDGALFIPGRPVRRAGRSIRRQAQVHVGLREAGPVVRVEAPAGGEAFIVTEYELARAVLLDHRFAKDPALAPADWHGRDPGLEPPAAVLRALTTT